MKIPNNCSGILNGESVISDDHGKPFFAFEPATASALPEAFFDASPEVIDRAGRLAADAKRSFSDIPGEARGALLRRIADVMCDHRDAIVARCRRETGYVEPRVQGEFDRATGQLRTFAELAETRRWDETAFVRPDPDRKPIPRPSMRRRLIPVGPVAVFGACNFPLAISVAGNDLVAAFASGSPVVVKSHPSHPGTCQLVGQAVADAVKDLRLHPGIFGLVHGFSPEVSLRLVQHPEIAAVGFTGSPTGGKAIADAALKRDRPVPVYAELGSTNPVFVTDAAMRERVVDIAEGFVQSLRFGNGHMCTKPGVLVVTRSESQAFKDQVIQRLKTADALPMLNESIADAFDQGCEQLEQTAGTNILFRAPEPAASEMAWCRGPVWVGASAKDAIEHDLLHAETFGPLSILVECDDDEEWLSVAKHFRGSLTATLHHGSRDTELTAKWLREAEDFAGRLISNGWPTGMEIGPATQHGGPFPASLDGRSTSVGYSSIDRFVRPICYQNGFDP